MGIFSSIKNAIFGNDDDQAQSTAQQQQATASQSATMQPNAPPPPAPTSEVDVAERLGALPGASQLNWRSSIVDLMKLIGVDCGPVRLPLTPLDAAKEEQLSERLQAIGFFEYASKL